MRALVTGAAGFIGSHLVDTLLDRGDDVVGLDSFTDYYTRMAKERNVATARANPRFTFATADLSRDDLRSVVEGAEVVYHCAGRPGVREAMMQFEQYWHENVIATQRLLEAVKELQLKSFVYASSSSVYGDAELYPTTETAVPAPLSPYGVTKLAGEHLAYVYWRNYRVPAVRLRYFSVYGPRLRPDLTVNQALDLLTQVSGVEVKRRNVDRQPFDHRREGASITRARIQLGWEPRTSLREGLSASWRWFLEAQEQLTA